MHSGIKERGKKHNLASHAVSGSGEWSSLWSEPLKPWLILTSYLDNRVGHLVVPFVSSVIILDSYHCDLWWSKIITILLTIGMMSVFPLHFLAALLQMLHPGPCHSSHPDDSWWLWFISFSIHVTSAASVFSKVGVYCGRCQTLKTDVLKSDCA